MEMDLAKQETCFNNAMTVIQREVSSMSRRNQNRLHLRFHAGGGLIKRADILPFDLPAILSTPAEFSPEGVICVARNFLQGLAKQSFFGTGSIYFTREDEIVSVRQIEYFPSIKLDVSESELVQQFS